MQLPQSGSARESVPQSVSVPMNIRVGQRINHSVYSSTRIQRSVRHLIWAAGALKHDVSGENSVRIRSVLAIYCILSLGLLGSTAYPQLKEIHIDSSAERKKHLLDSRFFQLLHFLYPNGTKNSHFSSKLNKMYQNKLNEGVLVAEKYKPAFAHYFTEELQFERIPTLRLVAESDPSANIDRSHINVTIALLRDNLAAGVTDEKIVSYSPLSRDKLISDLFALERQIKKTEVGNWTFRITDGTDQDELLALQDAFNRVEGGYDDATTFMLYHELGHKVLGHLDRPRTCAVVPEEELAADRFAMYLMGIKLGEQEAMMSRPNSVPRFSCLAAEPETTNVFLERSYRLAGFEQANGCQYPPLAERIRGSQGPIVEGYKVGIASRDPQTPFCVDVLPRN